jgi:hypothetical protein
MKQRAPVPSMSENDIALLREALARAEARSKKLELALQETVLAHDRLALEFHHRIKNSLQVIQSYLALSRRQKSPERNPHLVESEAKVLIISGAYRMALGEGSDHRLFVETFIVEIVQNALLLLLTPDQQIKVLSTIDRWLALDKAIPLGLAIVEAAILGMTLSPNAEILLCVQDDQPDRLRVTLSLAGPGEDIPAPNRVMQGLRAQLGAIAQPARPGVLLDWIIAA